MSDIHQVASVARLEPGDLDVGADVQKCQADPDEGHRDGRVPLADGDRLREVDDAGLEAGASEHGLLLGQHEDLGLRAAVDVADEEDRVVRGETEVAPGVEIEHPVEAVGEAELDRCLDGRRSAGELRDSVEEEERGGNLAPSDLGASAPYGLGVVHLLPFDVARSMHDPWVHARLLEMVSHAIERRHMILFPHARRAESTDDRGWRATAIGHDSDPRWMLLVAGALLALYAFAAGPMLRRLTVGKGRVRLGPMLTPAAATAAVGALLVLSCAADRRSARTTRVEIIEAAAGMPRATSTSYTARTGRAQQRGAISAACPACLISSLSGAPGRPEEVRTARGPTLELVPAAGAALRSRVTREDAFVELTQAVGA